MITITEAQLSSWLAAYFWPLIRIGAVVTAAPIFNSRQLPLLAKAGLVLMLTLVIVPVIPPSPVVQVFTADALQMTMQQILIGLMIGFVLQMVFAALVFSGQVIAFSMGLGFASLVDPQNGVQVPVISQFYMILAIILFLTLDAHLVLIDILARSFYTFPVALDGVNRNHLSEIVNWGSRMFSSGVLMALPIVAALLLVNLGMGIITRAAPQLNIFAVGFPLTILLGMLLMWSTLPNVLHNFSELVNEALFMIQQMLNLSR